MDLSTALIACVIANVFRGRKEAYKIEDFLLRFGEDRKRKIMSADRMKQLLIHATLRMGGTVVDASRYSSIGGKAGP